MTGTMTGLSTTMVVLIAVLSTALLAALSALFAVTQRQRKTQLKGDARSSPDTESPARLPPVPLSFDENTPPGSVEPGFKPEFTKPSGSQQGLCELDELSMYRQMFDAVDVPIIVRNKEGKGVLFNKAWYRYSNQSEDDSYSFGGIDLAKVRLADGTTPASRQDTVGYYAMQGDVVRRRMYHQIIEDETAVPVLVSGFPLYKDREQQVGSFITVENVSRLQQVEEELERESSFIKQVISSLPDGVVFRDMTGRAVFYNEALTESLTSEERARFVEAPKEDWLEFPCPAVAIEPGTSPSSRALNGETVISEELLVKKPGVTERRILVTALPIYSEGKQVGAFTITRDVRDYTRELETRAQRSRLDALGTLAGGIAHDFNNQLATIMGSAQVAQTRLHDSDRVSHHLDTIVKVCKSGSQLTRQLMSLGQSSAGERVSLELSQFIEGFRPIIDRVFQAFATVSIQFDDAPLTIFCDPVQLESVLLNLLLNAKDATESSTARIIRLRISKQTASQSVSDGMSPNVEYVRISVIDNGIGMSSNVRNRALEPFFTTKVDSDGFGLGLATVNGFVRQLQGVVAIDSVENESTSVSLCLPLSADSPALTPGADSVEPQTGNGETILVVEDRRELRYAMASMLTGLDYNVITASSGEDGISRFNGEETIDLALVDVVLPGGMGGVKMVSEVKKDYPDVKVIFVSGFMGDEFNDTTLDYPFLQKPVSREKLAREISFELGAIDSR